MMLCWTAGQSQTGLADMQARPIAHQLPALSALLVPVPVPAASVWTTPTRV